MAAPADPAAGAYTPAYLSRRDKLSGGSGRSLTYVLGNMLSAGKCRAPRPAPFPTCHHMPSRLLSAAAGRRRCALVRSSPHPNPTRLPAGSCRRYGVCRLLPPAGRGAEADAAHDGAAAGAGGPLQALHAGACAPMVCCSLAACSASEGASVPPSACRSSHWPRSCAAPATCSPWWQTR